MMAVFKILKNRLDVRQASGVFDGEPHLLGVKNGVIDLRNGSFKPHNIKTLVTSAGLLVDKNQWLKLEPYLFSILFT